MRGRYFIVNAFFSGFREKKSSATFNSLSAPFSNIPERLAKLFSLGTFVTVLISYATVSFIRGVPADKKILPTLCAIILSRSFVNKVGLIKLV